MTSCAGSSPASGLTPELLNRAQSQGVVLVIVTLRVPEGASHGTIAALKSAVIAEVASTRHRVVRELAGLPQIALEASAETLRILAASPRVLRIDESIPHSPLR